MPAVIQIKGRQTGAAGAPSALAPRELAFNEVDGTLYYGKGGSGTAAASILAIAGDAKQNASANLSALAALTGAADRLPYFTGAGALALATLTNFARTLLSQTTAAAARGSLGAAASGANSDITSLSGLTTALSVAQGGTGGTTAADARAGLGLGTLATQAANNVSITGGSITGVTLDGNIDGGTF